MDLTITSQIINFQVIPAVLLPVTGLALLVFYNRSAAINQRMRLVQKELRDHLIRTSSMPTKQDKELLTTLENETNILTKRMHIIGISMICCLLAILLFTICAVLITLALFYPVTIHAAIVFWLAGPVFICAGILLGLAELFFSFRSLQMQTSLIEEWKDN